MGIAVEEEEEVLVVVSGPAVIVMGAALSCGNNTNDTVKMVVACALKRGYDNKKKNGTI